MSVRPLSVRRNKKRRSQEEVGCVWGLGGGSAYSQGSVPVRSCLNLVGQLECVLGNAQQSGAHQRCNDAPWGDGGGLAGPRTSRPRLRPD